ncbi:Rieske (2Fe-2S) protein [Methylovirgula sp. HY1]|uniref:Rieske (2Fe-2S) protein n=1 Tax=Methylovirgula sp. HY1 TaxID=2822761 RepID=UPI001C76CA8E|nr:Naphthalene 1,2-dioxygenase system ferredoxin subunit [Methylovirgula sp. HY1]
MVAGRAVLLSRVKRLVSGFDNLCPHFGFEIASGKVENGRIACPHHGFIFDLMSGACLTVPDVRLTSHAIRLIGDRVEISLRS